MCKKIEFGNKLMLGISLLAHKNRRTIACEEFDMKELQPREKVWFENGVKIYQEKNDTIFKVTLEDKEGKLESRYEGKNGTIFFASRNAINVIVKNNKTGHSHSIRIWRQSEGSKKVIRHQRTYQSYQETSANQHLDLSEFQLTKPKRRNTKKQKHPAGRKPKGEIKVKHTINVRGMNSEQATEVLA